MTSPTVAVSPVRLRTLEIMPATGAGELDRGLVGFDLDQVFVLLGGLALALEPLADLDFGDRFADCGHFQFNGHSGGFPQVCWQSVVAFADGGPSQVQSARPMVQRPNSCRSA